MLYASLSRVLLFRIHRVTKKETLISQGFQSGDGGIRTHVPFRTTRFRVFQSEGFPVFFGVCLC